MATYNISFVEPTGSVQGTITTDCSPCIIGPTDITAWNLTLTALGSTDTLNDSNSVFHWDNSNFLVATPLELTYDFNHFAGPVGFGAPGVYGLFPVNGTAFYLDQEQIAWQVGTIHIIPFSAPNAPPSNIIGIDPPGVPEPATLALMLVGMLLVTLPRKLFKWL